MINLFGYISSDDGVISMSGLWCGLLRLIAYLYQEDCVDMHML